MLRRQLQLRRTLGAGDAQVRKARGLQPVKPAVQAGRAGLPVLAQLLLQCSLATLVQPQAGRHVRTRGGVAGIRAWEREVDQERGQVVEGRAGGRGVLGVLGGCWCRGRATGGQRWRVGVGGCLWRLQLLGPGGGPDLAARELQLS